jgi:hypothetical protein
MQISDKGIGVNGDMVVWSQPQALEFTLNIIPDSDDDKNLDILFNANRAAKNKLNALDIITMIVSYPDGTQIRLINGKCGSYMPLTGIASNSRKKSKPYQFYFENKI